MDDLQATDGGPGSQGLSEILQRRAVMLVHVGETVWETPDPEPELAEVVTRGSYSFSFDGSVGDCLAELSEVTGLTLKVRDVDLERPAHVPLVRGTAGALLDAVAGALGLAWRRVDGMVEFYTA
ncbi:MAG: hypothetical protein R3F62_17550 [Planctomycetota bacterium]